jgi:hypothetical protein
MKKTLIHGIFAVIFALAFAALSLTGCDNGSTNGGNGDDPNSSTYIGYDSAGKEYQLKITKAAAGNPGNGTGGGYASVANTGGSLTINGLSQFNGKWVFAAGGNGVLDILAFASATTSAATCAQISGGSATLKVWEMTKVNNNLTRLDNYSGSDTGVFITVCVVNKATITNAEAETGAAYSTGSRPDWLVGGGISFSGVDFTNGSATFTPEMLFDYNDLPVIPNPGDPIIAYMDSRLINGANDAWIDSYPVGNRDGFIFKANNGGFHLIDDYTNTPSGVFAVYNTTPGICYTSGNNSLTLNAPNGYYETFTYTVTGNTLILTNASGVSETFTKTQVAVNGRSVGVPAPAGKAGTKAVTGAIKRAVGDAVGNAAAVALSSSAGRAAAVQSGDKFTLTIKNAGGATEGTSTGTVDAVSNDGETLTLNNNGEKFTAKIKGQAIAGITGSIPLDGGGTLTAPETLTITKPVTNPSTGGPANWIAIADIGFGSNTITAIAYGSGRFVAGSYGSGYATTTTMAYSDDGVTWTALPSNDDLYSIRAIAYGNNRFVAGGQIGRIAYSDNGINWTIVPDANNPFYGYNSSIEAIAYEGGRWVAGGVSGKMAYSDDNGVTWTAVSNSTFGSYINSIAYGNNRFVAVGDNGEMAYSDDGITWTAVQPGTNKSPGQTTFDDSSINGIAYGNNKFVAVNGNGQMAYSTNGASWTAVSNTISIFYTNSIRAIAYGNGRFVAAGDISIAYSSDGVTWTAVQMQNIVSFVPIYSLAYGNGRFVSVGQSGKMAYCDW